MTKDTIIYSKLMAEFSPILLEVIDESEQHRGHAGWREGGDTHFRIKIVSTEFSGKTRVAMHRMINECLAEELAGGIHALAIEARGA
ncbi:BolA family protein [Flexibacterium corallicola]|uniref:BolA family protein n=1 Tax=Flexibacterium corallicola TaxID=3037259 RepID=UPI00286F196B|nr:BolA family protein [Pseudovibrio sp. M1P-2-3]